MILISGFGGAVKLSGEAEYRQALKQITTNLKEVSSEMKVVSTAFDKNDKSTEAMRAKTEALTKQLTAQNSALSILKDQYSKLSAEQAKNDANHNKLLADYKDAQEQLVKIGNELGKDSDEYLNQALVVADLAKAVDKSTATNQKNEQTLSGMRTEMNNLQSSINSTGTELKNANQATDELSKSTKKAGESAKKAGDGFTIFKGIISNLASQAITSALNGLKSMGGAIVSVGKDAVKSYADYEQLKGGIETLFGAGGKSLEEYASSIGKSVDQARGKFFALESAQNTMLKNANNAYKTAGMDANTYMETVTSFSASLISSLGGDTQKSAEIADMAMRDISDNANKFGSDVESIAQVYSSLAKGQYQTVDNLKLGFAGTKEGMQDLIKRAEELDGSFKAQRDSSGKLTMSYADMVNAIHIVQTEMGITGTTAKEASSTISGSLNSMQASWKNLLTGMADGDADLGSLISNFTDSIITFGKNIIPVIKQMISGLGVVVSGLMQELIPQIIQMIPPLISEGLPVLIDAVGTAIQSILGILPDVISVFAELIPQICATLISSLPEILSAGMDIIIALTNGLSTAIPQLISMLPELISTIVGFFVEGDNLGKLIDAGIELTMAITDGLMDALPQLLEQLPILIAKVISKIIENLPKLIEMGVKLTTSLASGLIKAMPSLIMMIPTLIKELVNELKNNFPKIVANGASLVASLVDGVKSRIESARLSFAELVAKIVSWLGELPSKMINIGKNLISGIWSGISDALGSLKQNIKKMASGITDAVKKAFSIHSPSLLWKTQIGKNLALGLGEGFSDEMKNVTAMMEESIPTSFDLEPSLNTSAIRNASESSMSSYGLVEALKSALQGMRIEMGEDGFASFVVDTITNEIYR